MDEVTTTTASTASSPQPDDDAEPADRFPLMWFCAEIRVMIWNAAMPEFAPCHFRLRCDGDSSEEILTLIAKGMTKSQRTPIAALSSVCHESRNEVILKYPDLLPLHSGHCMRFSFSRDVVMLTELEKTTIHGRLTLRFWLQEQPTSSLHAVVRFPLEWNDQIQNIALKPHNAFELASFVGSATVGSRPQNIDTWIELVEGNFSFLSLFPRLKNYFAKHTVVCASEDVEIVKKACQEASIQVYVEQEFSSPEQLPPGSPLECGNMFPFRREDIHNDIVTFLRYRRQWTAGVDMMLHRLMHANTHMQEDTEDRTLATRLRGINYSTIVGFWKCNATHSEVVALGKKYCREADSLL